VETRVVKKSRIGRERFGDLTLKDYRFARTKYIHLKGVVVLCRAHLWLIARATLNSDKPVLVV
jgi:hypothetical protein